jgi:hypothetical protein
LERRSSATITTVAIKHKELILGVPSAVFLLTAFVTQAYTYVVLTKLARAAAESALDHELGPLSTFYGTLAAPYREGSYLVSVAAIGITGVLLAICASVAGGIIAHSIHLHRDLTSGHTVFIAYVIATTLFAVVASVAFLDFWRASRHARRAYEEAMRQIRADPGGPAIGT